ncbi:MAG: methionyl-tRNA formyltransferase [Micropepsaceae bacterium]
MRIAFLGTPEFAVPTLEALIAAGHEVACVYSQPPRPSGRGHKLQNSPVHETALKHGLQVRTPVSLKPSHEQQAFAELNLDAAIVVAYGLLLPKAILDAPRLGCFNLHGSLLPRWRGAAPIQRAIMEGDIETGVMIMKMDVGLDTGPVLSEWRTPISDTTTTGDLQVSLAREGASLMVATIGKLASGPVAMLQQESEGVTYARKITPEEARIDWSKPAHAVLRHIHGLNPAPGAWTMFGDTRLKILRVKATGQSGTPGRIIAAPLVIACGEGAIEITELQRAGRGAQASDEFVRGFPVAIGAQLN